METRQPLRYTPSDWYWIVGGDEAQVYSSKYNTFMSADDQRYVEWATRPDKRTTRILNQDELNQVLVKAGLVSISD